MERSRAGSIILAVSITSMVFLIAFAFMLGEFNVLSGMNCLWFLFIFFIFLSSFVISLVLIFVGKKGPGERYDLNGIRMRCPKCNAWIDISKAVRPCVVKCKKCSNPVLLDVEEEFVKVQCPKCMTPQVSHILARPAEVPCKECGVTLVIPKKY